MARRPADQPSSEKEWTPDSIRAALRKLRRRVADVRAFDPKKVLQRRDGTVTALETSIRETLSDVFGRFSGSFRNYELAATVDTARYNVNGVPHSEVIEGYARGKERSIQLLSGAIRAFEEKMEDDFPGEPLDQMTLQAPGIPTASTAIGMTELPGTRGANPLNSGLQGVGTGLPEIKEVTGSSESRYEELQARVALLESSVDQLRRELVSSSREVGIGHNQGPAFAPVPVEELHEIDDLVALLKDRGPMPPSDPTPLIEQNARVAKLGEKINKGLIDLGTEMAKGAAGEMGKQLIVACWAAVYGWIKSVGAALLTWLSS